MQQRRGLTRVGACVQAAAVLGCAGWAAGQTELYFIQASYQNSKIYAIGLNGTNPRELFSLPPEDSWIAGMVVNAATGRIWYTDTTYSMTSIGSVGTAGTPPPGTVVPLFEDTARGTAIDSQGRVYFAEENTIRRVNPDGTGLETLISGFQQGTLGSPYVDRTNGHVYFGADGEIKRMNLDGSNVKTVVKGVSLPWAVEVDVGGRYVYWIDIDAGADHVARARLDGSEFRVLFDNTPNTDPTNPLEDVLLDRANGKVYFSQNGTATIRSISTDGTNPQLVYTVPVPPGGYVVPTALALSTGDPAEPLNDCNGNGVADDADIAGGAPDCNNNGVPDSCEAQPCPSAFLLDNQSFPAPDSRYVGDPQELQQYQPFDVPAGGWTVGQIGVDGHTTEYTPGGMIIELFPDDGTGEAPNEAVAPLATVSGFQLRYDPLRTEIWEYAPLVATLPEGRFWLRFRASDPANYQGNIRTGIAGLSSKYRFVGGTNTLLSHTVPLAVRLIEGSGQPPCRADFDQQNGVQVADIFAFLRAWFANAPSADFDQMNGIQVADIFAFLRAWFAGCP